MVDHIRRPTPVLRGRSSTTVSRYVQSPSAAFGLREEEHEPIHRVDLLRRMLLHQQAGEEEEDHAWPVSGEPCLHRAARRRGGIKKEGPPVVTFPFDAPRGIYDPHFTSLAVPSGHFA